jgi:predicted secreted protein
MMIKLARSVSVLMLFFSTGFNNVLAHDNETHYDRVHLSVSASAQLENDTMVAIVSAQEEGVQAAELSNIVNQRIRRAMDLVKIHPEIKHQTNAYSSNPVYSNNKIKGWRVSQSLRLESKDMTLMSDVLGRLQSELALQSIQFTISPENKNKQDEKLIDKALQAFEDRARQVAKKLGGKNYRIVDINIVTSGSMESVKSAPAISAGEQTITVTVNGNIELN